MTTKLAATSSSGMHTAGIFADMTVDGPEIGTLVLIVDRAKNLPNRKTMGKQNPYCAARLGKEAKKTETDKRGGQTPKWDQELRFTVHDSPDYHNIKISVFSEDKKTDLIGEAWVGLGDVVICGGGKQDLWQGLHFKGKYAGELRIELTYYDSRPKPEMARDSIGGDEDLRQYVGGGARVKRRPLPHHPNTGALRPDTIPEPALPGRAKHGPRDYRTPPRANSMSPEITGYPHQHLLYSGPPPMHRYDSSPSAGFDDTPQNQYYGEHEVYQHTDLYERPMQQPNFLPQLPPSDLQRDATQTNYGSRQAQALPAHLRPQSQTGLQHSNSAPAVPTTNEPAGFEDRYQLYTDHPESIPDVEFQNRQMRQRRTDVRPGWESEHGDIYVQSPQGLPEQDLAPPPPPMHSKSAPAVPHITGLSPANSYDAPSLNPRHQSIPNGSPLQNIERNYGQGTPIYRQQPRGTSVDGYSQSPDQSVYGTSSSLPQGQTPSPLMKTSAARAMQHRHSMTDTYKTTPPRPHPLSQEVPRMRSQQRYSELPGSSPRNQPQYQHDYRDQNTPPLIKPRAISPRPGQQGQSDWRPKSSYSLQFPVRAFESSDQSPLSTSQPHPQSAAILNGSSMMRKSLSPRPLPPDSRRSSVPFSPESFDMHNPNARATNTATSPSPHSPYHVRPGSEATHREEAKGPIVGWHGQEIDPSDHLPVDSWAPEPEKKTPTKTYGLGRDRDFGPRTADSSTGTGSRLSNDTVVNVRMKNQHQAELNPPSPTRNRLVKKNDSGRSPVVEPLREHDNFNPVPNPYDQQQQYSRRFYGADANGNTGSIGGAPTVPPKVPLQQQDDALAREISSIDIGSNRRSRVAPAPTAYMPVRSSRDRNSYC